MVPHAHLSAAQFGAVVVQSNFMSVKVSPGQLFYSFFYVSFIVAIIFWVLDVWNNVPIEDYRAIAAPWVFASFAVNVVGLVVIKHLDFSHAGVWFVILSYMFMFGHVVTFVFSLDTSLIWDPSVFFTETAKLNAAAYAVLAVTLVSFGCFLFSSSRFKMMEEIDDAGEKKYMKRTGAICFLVGFICSLANAYNVVSAAQASGSYSIYMVADTSGVVDDLAYLLVPGALLLFFSDDSDRVVSKVALVFSVVFYLLVMALSGSRKMAIFAILALVVAYSRSKTRSALSSKRLAALVLLGILFLNLIFVIREYRTSIEEIIPAYIDSLVNLSFAKNLLAETLTETGLTFFSVAGIVQAVPSVFPFELGMTIVKTLPSALPLGWLFGDVFDSAASTYVINGYIGVPVGASLLGDFYWNWGLVGGSAASFLFGALLPVVYGKCFQSRYGMAIYFSFFYILLVGVRAGIFELFRPMLVAVLGPFLIGLIFRGKIPKGRVR